jgi:hypothetical protein
LKDDQGKGYLVDSKGNVHQVTAAIATRAGSRVYDLKMTFEPNSITRYGLEEKPHDALAQDYEQIGQYKVKWKSLPASGTDQVNAVVGEGTDASNVDFELGGQPVQAPPFSGGIASVTLAGKSDGTVESLIALIPSDSTNGKDKVVGKLNVISYNAITPTLVIVPVGNVRLPGSLNAQTIQTELNKIYNQAVVDWRVSVADPLEFTPPNPFDNGESGLLSNYTADMRAVISAYGSLQDETYYLFLVNNPKNEGAGYMPRGKESGFIYVDRHSGDADLLVRTMAHELGHGAFNLHHTFDEPNFTIARGSSDNLMDYPAGDKLFKFQWDKIRYPDVVIGIFEEDEEAAYSTGIVYRCISPTLTKKSPEEYYKNLKGKTIKLGPNYEPYAFVGSGDQDDPVGAVAIIRRITDGALYFPAQNDTELPYYYKRISISGIDKNDVLNLPEESQTPTLVTINSDSTYVIQRGIERITGKANEINCFGNGSLSAPTGLIVNSLLRQAIQPEVMAKLTALMTGNRSNRLTQENHKIRGRIFLTSEIAANNVSTLTIREVGGKEYFYVDTTRQVIGANEVAFWVEYNADGKIRIKKIIAGDSFDQGLAVALKSWDAQLDWKQKTFFQKFISISYEVVDGYFTATYDMLDMLSSGIGYLRIPESVYNCNLPAGQYNPIYAKVFSFLNISAALQDIVAERLVQEYPEFAPILANGDLSQIQFALFCGVYNGLVGVIQSVPQLAQLLVSPLSSAGREANSEFLQSISEKEIYAQTESGEQGELLYGKGLGFGKIWFLLSEGILSQFKANTPCVTAHFVGEIIGPVIVMCVGDVSAASGVASRVAATAIRILQLCDKLGDPLHYAGLSFKLLKSGAGKLVVIVKDQVGDVIRQIDNDLFMVKVMYDNTTLPELQLTSQQVEQLVAAGASGMDYVVEGVERRIVLAVSPGSLGSATAETISRQIFGSISTEVAQALWKRFDDLGLDAVQVDKAMAALGKSADVVVDNANKLATLLENAPFASAPNKLREFVDNIIAEAELQDLVKAGDNFASEWDYFYANTILRTEADILLSLRSALAKGHLTRADLDEILAVNSTLKNRAAPTLDLLRDLDHFANYRNQPGFDDLITSLKSTGANSAGADGANWVIAVLRKQGNGIFPYDRTSFEVTENVLGQTRRYDAIVSGVADGNAPVRPKYFEFKSYKDVPPPGFAEQFAKDLNNPRILDLDQLVWIFDKAKNPSNFVANMKTAIDNLPLNSINAATLAKFGAGTVPQLKTILKAQFDSIIQLK